LASCRRRPGSGSVSTLRQVDSDSQSADYGVMWCSNAVNCVPLRTIVPSGCFTYTFKSHRRATDPAQCPGARGGVSVFPLATSLSSTISAGPGPLVDGFSGTTDVSDFSAT
jgi:hypothetical protein